MDTFAFRGDSQVHHRRTDLHQPVLRAGSGRGPVRRFARFEPGAPRPRRRSTALVQRTPRRAPWRAPLPMAERIVVPGFGSLHELTREAEAAARRPRGGSGRSCAGRTGASSSRSPRKRERVAAEIIAGLQAGRPAQLLITDFPRIRCNHSVLAFDFRASDPDAVDFSVYDPNDPTVPGVIRFDRRERRYRPAPLCGVDVPYLRAFRMYCSPLL